MFDFALETIHRETLFKIYDVYNDLELGLEINIMDEFYSLD